MASFNSLQVDASPRPKLNGVSSAHRVIEIDPIVDPKWDKLTRTVDHGSLFSSVSWLRVLQKTYGFSLIATVAEDVAGHVVGGIAHVLVSDLRGERIISLPFSDFCDPLVAKPEVWSTLVDALS